MKPHLISETARPFVLLAGLAGVLLGLASTSPPLPFGAGGGGDPTQGHPENTHGPAPVIYRPQVALLAGQLVPGVVIVPPVEGIRLEWNQPFIPVDFYRIHQGPHPGAYTNTIEIPGSLQTCSFIGLDESIKNYFVVNAFTLGMNGQGVVSQFSNEAVYSPFVVDPLPEPPLFTRTLFTELSSPLPTGPWTDLLTNIVTLTNENAFFRVRIQ